MNYVQHFPDLNKHPHRDACRRRQDLQEAYTLWEDGDRIEPATQRKLINNLILAAQMGAEVIRIKNDNIVTGKTAVEKQVITVGIGKPVYH